MLKSKKKIAFMGLFLSLICVTSCDVEQVTPEIQEKNASMAITSTDAQIEENKELIYAVLARDAIKSEQTIEKIANNLRTEASNNPNDASYGQLWQSNTITQGVSSYIYIQRKSLSADYRYTAVVEENKTLGDINFGLGYLDNGKIVWIANSSYMKSELNPTKFSGATSKSITFNLSNYSSAGKIPDNVQSFFIVVQSVSSQKLNLKVRVYGRSVKLNVPFITQYKKDCGSIGFTNSFCGHTCFEMNTAYLYERTPSNSNIFPTTNCDETGKKIPTSSSDWLAKIYPKENYCNSCGDGTPNPSYIKNLAINFGDRGIRGFNDVQWWATKDYSNNKPDIYMPAQDAMKYLWQELSYGYPVMVQVHIGLDTSNGTHWMLLVGLDNEYIYFNDPGTKFWWEDGQQWLYNKTNNIGYNRKEKIARFATSWSSSATQKRAVVIHGGTKAR